MHPLGRYVTGEPAYFNNALEYKEFADQTRARAKAVLRCAAATAPVSSLHVITAKLHAAMQQAKMHPELTDAWVAFETAVIFLDGLA